MNFYNSLSKKIEEFTPVEATHVSMYACGPTVYAYPTIGNFRTYFLSDVVYRSLKFNGYSVKYIMNLTDVGHLASDADEGDDKLEKQAEKEQKDAREIADFYINDFMESLKKLNINYPTKFTRATDYINQQIDLATILEEKGFTYKTSDGLYFDTSLFPRYGELSGLKPDKILEGARVEVNPEKKHAADFALWKFSPGDKKRWQEWDSPWGVGFPGWHLECSAMAMKELGSSIDIHLGAEDLKMVHHQNEIAQSESASGETFVKYWLHGAFLLVNGGRMGKSLGNAYTLSDIISHGYDPLALRYFYTTAHYRNPLNFTFDGLTSAQNSLKKLYEIVNSYKADSNVKPSDKFINRFKDKIDDDLNIPEAVSVLWDMLKSNINETQKLMTALKMDEVLGLNIEEHIGYIVPQNILDLAKTRFEYRRSGIWDKADVIRRQINELGYNIEDIPGGTYKVKRKF